MNTFKVGDRVCLTRDVDRFPDFIARKGMVGTVCTVEIDGALAVKMDDTIAGCEEWDNQVWWTFDFHLEDIADDLAMVE